MKSYYFCLLTHTHIQTRSNICCFPFNYNNNTKRIEKFMLIILKSFYWVPSFKAENEKIYDIFMTTFHDRQQQEN